MTTRPNTVDDVMDWIKKLIGAEYSFSLWNEDPEFNNALCDLTDIQLIPVLDLTSEPQCERTSDTNSQPDTHILSTPSLERCRQWPEVFEISMFSVDEEYRL